MIRVTHDCDELTRTIRFKLLMYRILGLISPHLHPSFLEKNLEKGRERICKEFQLRLTSLSISNDYIGQWSIRTQYVSILLPQGSIYYIINRVENQFSHMHKKTFPRKMMSKTKKNMWNCTFEGYCYTYACFCAYASLSCTFAKVVHLIRSCTNDVLYFAYD